ncbi:MAG: PEGA domain-containing protein, partial [Parcubacteria group bacterium]
YRYNFKKNQVQKTGALVISTAPSGAEVTLNNEPLASATPIRENNILPDEYRVVVSKDGYYPWEKKLAIKTQETTFAEDIVLFRKGEPQKAIDYEMEWIDFSPDRQYAAFSAAGFGQGFLYLFNAASQKTKLLYSDKKPFSNPKILWSADGMKILFQNGNKTLAIATLGLKNIADISEIAKKYSLTDFRFGEADSNQLFAIGLAAPAGKGAVYRIDLPGPEISRIFLPEKYETALDYFINGNTLFIIKQIRDGNVILAKYDMSKTNGSAEFYKTLALNNASSAFVGVYGNKLAISDAANSNFYLINFDLDKILFNKSNVASVDFHRKKNYLLLQTNQELSYLNLSDSDLNEKNITRFSQGVLSAKWHKSPNYLAALQNNELRIIELDDRDGHFVIAFPAQNITAFSFDADSSNLYYLQDKQLWQLKMD